MRKQISELQFDLLCFPLDKLRWLNAINARNNFQNPKSLICSQQSSRLRPASPNVIRPVSPKQLARETLRSAGKSRDKLRSAGKSRLELPSLIGTRPRSVHGEPKKLTQSCQELPAAVPAPRRCQTAPATRPRLDTFDSLDDCDDVITRIGLQSIRNREMRKARMASLEQFPETGRSEDRMKLQMDEHWEGQWNRRASWQGRPSLDTELPAAEVITKNVSLQFGSDTYSSSAGSRRNSIAEIFSKEEVFAKQDSLSSRWSRKSIKVLRRLGGVFADAAQKASPGDAEDSYSSVGSFDSERSASELEKQGADLFVRYTAGQMEMLNELPSLAEIFFMGGYPYPDMKILQEIKQKEGHSSFLDLDEFVRIWSTYGERIQQFRQDVFHKASRDGTVVSVAQLPDMLSALGITPMPGALAPEVQLIVGGIGNSVKFEDFEQIYIELYNRAGLSRSVHKRALEVFEEHASGEEMLNGKAINNAVRSMERHWLVSDPQGFLSQDPEALYDALVNEIVAQNKEVRLTLDMTCWRATCRGKNLSGLALTRVPIPEDAGISRRAFLVVCNALHQSIASSVRDAMLRIKMRVPTADMQPWFGEKDILEVFDELGHVSPSIGDLVKELIGECGLQGKAKFSFGDLYTLVLAYLDVEGFSVSEREELAWLFDTFSNHLPDVEKDEYLRLSAVEIKRLLRWLCYTPSQFRIYDFLDRNGRDDETYMDLAGLTEIVADYRYANIGMVRDSFNTVEERSRGTLKSTWKAVPLDNLKNLMQTAGHRVSDESVAFLRNEAACSSSGTISWREFLRLEGAYRKLIKTGLKENLGFTDVECAELHKEFMQQIPRKGLETIVYEGFIRIALQHLPELVVDAKLRKLVRESDWNHNGKIEFRELLWIMRRLLDRDSREAISRARKIRKVLGYSMEEVRSLRELFSISDKDLSGFLDHKELKGLFSGLVAMTDSAEHELQGFLNDVDSNQDGVLDFWEFLRLMKSLQNSNWRNILGAADETVKSLDEKNLALGRRNAIVVVQRYGDAQEDLQSKMHQADKDFHSEIKDLGR